MADYSKCKERKPEDTVFEIQRILNEIGLFPVVRWTSKCYEGACSNRVTLHPLTVGTNGKGTDELYCMASGFAELMERLNNALLFIRDRTDIIKDETGFHEFPDEKEKTVSELLADPDPCTKQILSDMGCDDFFSKLRFLTRSAEQYGPGNDVMPVVPFADPADGTVRYVPHALVLSVVGSNGMAAGNNLTEAMVQGVSEVFERAVSHELITGRAVPPEIPDEELKKYSFYHLIEQVRAEGKYRVTLYDCSLGKGWPVAGICVNNLETGRFGLKLGAHPSFAVACERTLTESLQGRNMEAFSGICKAGSLEEANNYINYPNVSKTGNGVYPATLFTGKPGWEFRPWTEWEGLDNRGFLRGMIQLLKKEGLHPLFRDTSFLGFPSCFIVVPGFSDLFLPGEMQSHYLVSASKTIMPWRRFPDLTAEEEDRLLRVIRYKRDSLLENQIWFFGLRPLSERYSLERIAAWLALKQGKFDISKDFFRRCGQKSGDKDEQIYYNAMEQYTKHRKDGLPADEVRKLIRQFYREDIARKVCEDTADENGVMQKNFSRFNCYDCRNCAVSKEGDCAYIPYRETMIKVYRAMKAENVSQEKLLAELLEHYW